MASEPRPIPAVVTAGGRLTGAFAARAGTPIKALAPVGGIPVVQRVLDALRGASPRVGRIAVVGPVAELRAAGIEADLLIEEGATGPENVERGLNALAPDANGGLVLVCATDTPFLTPEAILWLLDHAPDDDTDIVFPIMTKAAYEGAFPGSPNTYAPLAGEEYTGGSVQLVRPAALARSRVLIERVFAARKSQFRMAALLGLPFVLKWKLGTLTVAQAEARASHLTGCRCHALRDADPRLAADIDNLADYEYVLGIVG